MQDKLNISLKKLKKWVSMIFENNFPIDFFFCKKYAIKQFGKHVHEKGESRGW
jgi:hypothetical protein